LVSSSLGTVRAQPTGNDWLALLLEHFGIRTHHRATPEWDAGWAALHGVFHAAAGESRASAAARHCTTPSTASNRGGVRDGEVIVHRDGNRMWRGARSGHRCLPAGRPVTADQARQTGVTDPGFIPWWCG